MKSRVSAGLRRVATVWLLWCWAVASAGASSVLEVSVGDMLGASELVFEGRVLAVRSRASAPGGAVRTEVTFAVAEIIKGAVPATPLVLSFLGGTVQGRTVTVAESRLPQPGERGIYFVESLSRPLVNPLYGWSQGHFHLVRDLQGVDRVMTQDRRPVLAAVAGGGGRSGRLSQGVARGLLAGGAGGGGQAMTAAAFKQKLRDMLDGR